MAIFSGLVGNLLVEDLRLGPQAPFDAAILVGATQGGVEGSGTSVTCVPGGGGGGQLADGGPWLGVCCWGGGALDPSGVCLCVYRHM